MVPSWGSINFLYFLLHLLRLVTCGFADFAGWGVPKIARAWHVRTELFLSGLAKDSMLSPCWLWWWGSSQKRRGWMLVGLVNRESAIWWRQTCNEYFLWGSTAAVCIKQSTRVTGIQRFWKSPTISGSFSDGQTTNLVLLSTIPTA